MAAYEEFASVYDIFMDNMDYDMWVEYIHRIWDKENNDNNCRNQKQNPAFIMKTVLKKLWQGNGIVCHMRITAKSLCHDQEIHIGADGQSNCCPSSI